MRLELSLYAHRLQNVAGVFRGTSDPYAVVTLLPSKPTDSDANPVVLGETEVIENTLSPEWTKTIRLPDYELGIPMRLAVNVCDRSSNNSKSMGCVIVEVGDILAAQHQVLGKRLKDGRGTVYASIRSVQGEGSGVIRLTFQCRNLVNVEGGGAWRRDKSDPFLELSRPVHAGVTDATAVQEWDNVFRSPPVMNNLEPTFDVSMELSALCGGKLDEPILVTVRDHERSGRHADMGSVQTTVTEILNMGSSPGFSELALAPPTESSDDTTRIGVGTIAVLKAQVSGVGGGSTLAAPTSSDESALSNQVSALTVDEAHDTVSAPASAPPTPTFLDYLRGGCTLNCCVAIDFTSSNGDPSHPTSLHYSVPASANNSNDADPNATGVGSVYGQALRAVLTPLRKFDDDGFWPVLGFGKQLANGTVSHCFQVGKTEWSKGVDGVVASYNCTVAHPDLVLAGPMVLTKVLENAANRARKSLEKERTSTKPRLSYVCFLVVANADGHVAEFDATLSCLQKLRDDAPMSIILVGIRSSSQLGDEDGAAPPPEPPSNSLKRLADQCPDNCIYVSFRDGDDTSEASRLALRELPDQIVAWFLRHDMSPPPPPPTSATETDIVVTDQEDDAVVA